MIISNIIINSFLISLVITYLYNILKSRKNIIYLFINLEIFYVILISLIFYFIIIDLNIFYNNIILILLSIAALKSTLGLCLLINYIRSYNTIFI